MIALLHRRYAGPDVNDDTGALVAKDCRKDAFGVRAGAREFIGVTDAGRFYFNENLALFRPREIHFADFQRCSCLECDCSFRLHDNSPPHVLDLVFIKPCPNGRNPLGVGCL